MGPGRAGVSRETGWNTDWNAKEPPLLWKAPAGAGASSCAIAGGQVYTMGSSGGRESVICLNAATGKEIWRQSYDCPPDKSAWEGGAAGTPVLDGDRVYTLSFRGQLFCWDARDGKKQWEAHMEKDLRGVMPKWGWVGNPLIAGQSLIVEPGGPDASRAALDKTTGRVLWRSGSDATAFSSPILLPGPETRAVLFNAAGLVGINVKDGTERFRHPWKTNFDVNAVIPVHRDDRFFIGSAYGNGIALIAPPAEQPIWRRKTTTIHFQSPVLFGEHLYFVGGEAEQPATLQCVEWLTGKECWAEKIGHERGHLIVAGDKLIVVTQDGELLLADASPADYRERGRFHALPKRVFTVPAFSDQRLYVRNNSGTLACYDLSP